MTAIEKWNRIVEIHDKHLIAKEQTVRDIWESIFAEILGFSRLDGEIERHRNVRIGSTERVITDIIIKDGVSDLFVVELKQHNFLLNSEMEMQLFSYLKQLRNDMGIIICKNIYIYAYDYNKSDDGQDKVEIEIVHNNPKGIKFVELFGKNTFAKAAVNEFIYQQNKFSKNVENIGKELSQHLIVGLIKTHFADSYEVSEIEKAMDGFIISVTPKGNASNFSSQSHVDSLDSRSIFIETYSPMSVNTSDQRTQRGGNEQAVFNVLRNLQSAGKINDSLLTQLKSAQYANQRFNISSFPFLLPVMEFPASGFERKRFYKRTFNHNGIEYYVCSQWIPERVSLLNKWYSAMSKDG